VPVLGDSGGGFDLSFFFIGKRLFGAKAGLWAMVILASTLMMLGVGTLATTDAVMLPFIVGVLAIFVQGATGSGMGAGHVILMGIAFGAGMLTKGPMGLLPVAVIAFTLWFSRKEMPDVWRQLWWWL